MRARETDVFDDSRVFIVYFPGRRLKGERACSQSALTGPVPGPIRRRHVRRRGTSVTVANGGKQMCGVFLLASLRLCSVGPDRWEGLTAPEPDTRLLRVLASGFSYQV